MKKLTPAGIGALTLAAALALALAAQAGGITLAKFIKDFCGGTIGPDESVQVDDEDADGTTAV